MICGLLIRNSSLRPKTRQREIDRKTTPGLYLLRATHLGLSVEDLKQISVGLVMDMLIESSNDQYDYPVLATKEDIDRL